MKFLVAQGDKSWLEKKGFIDVFEHEWWQPFIFNKSGQDAITCTFLPANHWSARGLFDRNKSLWGSWMISTSAHTLYFAGDTAYSSHFSAIANEFPTINCALMPIGPQEPHIWMRKTHLDAAQAVQAFIDLKADHFIPMHWGTFQFGLDMHGDPLHKLHAAWQDKALLESPKKLSVLKIGQSLLLNG